MSSQTLRRKIKADVRKQHDLYVNNLVDDVKANPRDFYRYINSQKKDTEGIPSLTRKNRKGVAQSDLEKAEEFNDQFTDVPNKNEHTQVPLLDRSAPFMDDIVVPMDGVIKLLKGLNPSKALGPDELHHRVLKELATELGRKSNAKLLIIGLDNAGKSTLLDRVASGRMLQHPPTTQCRSKELSLGSLKFTAFDLGGHRQARRVWRDYFPAVDGIIFMVDVADADRFPEARAELDSLLHDDNISDIPVVVLANKTDRKDAVGEEMAVSSLGLSIYRTGRKYTSKAELPGRPLEVFPCSILRQEGYGDGFRWLAHYVKQNG